MKPASVYRGIAAINGIVGLLLAFGIVVLGFSLARHSEEDAHLYLFGMVIIMAIIAVGLIWTALSYFRTPDMKNALSLAVNTSVIIWACLARLTQSTELEKMMGPAHIAVSIVVAYLVYRLGLKPLARRVT